MNEKEKNIEKIKSIFHKYCSGTIDEKGHCYLSSDMYDAVAEEIIKEMDD